MKLLKPFLFGGIFMTIISYFTNNFSPVISSILNAFPFGLLSLHFVQNKDKKLEFSIGSMFMSFIILATYLGYHYLVKHDLYKGGEVELALFFWFLLSVILYLYKL